ncbi:MAG: hypothetical protein HRU15_07730 [Planctomycetes bacterium]|nr:hypothetical protein [Planctomycetota bacterium]
MRKNIKGSPTMQKIQLLGMISLIMIFCVSCESRSSNSSTSSHGKRHKSSIKSMKIISNITSVSEHQGNTLIELPVGSQSGIRSGTFFRVYANNESNLIKGTIKVDEVIDGKRSLARLVGELLDRKQPLMVNDTVKEIRDLGAIVRNATAEEDTRKNIEKQAKVDESEQKQFENLRQNFQRELKNIKDLHQQDIQLLEQRHQRAITRVNEDHQSQIKRKDLERMTDLAALQATLKRGEKKLLKTQKHNDDEKFTDLQQERNILDTQIQSLLVQQHTQKNRISSLLEEIAFSSTIHKKKYVSRSGIP